MATTTSEVAGQTSGDVLVLSARDVSGLLTADQAVRAVEQALRDLARGMAAGRHKARIDVSAPDEERFLLAMPGAIAARGLVGVKWVGSFAQNPRRGLPRIRAALLLTRACDGTPLALLEATGITALRTGAAIAVAARHCARPEAAHAAIIGFGAVGQAALRALVATLPTLRDIRVAGGDAQRRANNAGRIAAELGRSIRSCDVPAAVRGADVVVTATGLTRDDPVVESDWIGAGTFVCAVGGHQEIGSDLILRAERRLVDDLDNARHRGNLAPLFQAKRLHDRDIHADLAAVAAGDAPGRVAAEELVICSLTGLGLLDIAIAADIYERAVSAGVGRRVAFS